MSRYINVDNIRKPIYAEEDNCTGIGMTFDEMDAYNNGIDAMIRQIDNVPTADVKEVVHGEWIEFGNKIECPFCKYSTRLIGVDKYNYCPNCGAKMGGEQNDL